MNLNSPSRGFCLNGRTGLNIPSARIIYKQNGNNVALSVIVDKPFELLLFLFVWFNGIINHPADVLILSKYILTCNLHLQIPLFPKEAASNYTLIPHG